MGELPVLSVLVALTEVCAMWRWPWVVLGARLPLVSGGGSWDGEMGNELVQLGSAGSSHVEMEVEEAAEPGDEREREGE